MNRAWGYMRLREYRAFPAHAGMNRSRSSIWLIIVAFPAHAGMNRSWSATAVPGLPAFPAHAGMNRVVFGVDLLPTRSPPTRG